MFMPHEKKALNLIENRHNPEKNMHLTMKPNNFSNATLKNVSLLKNTHFSSHLIRLIKRNNIKCEILYNLTSLHTSRKPFKILFIIPSFLSSLSLIPYWPLFLSRLKYTASNRQIYFSCCFKSAFREAKFGLRERAVL